jgi:hypothetical protein
VADAYNPRSAGRHRDGLPRPGAFCRPVLVTLDALGLEPLSAEALRRRPAVREIEAVAPGLVDLFVRAIDGDQKAIAILEELTCPRTDMTIRH